jgi:hypothetical protein
MFFVKALGGCMVAVFGGLYFTGFFDGEQAVLDAVETVRRAEAEDNRNARWGPHCPGLRDKLMGMEDGVPTDIETNGLRAIAKINAVARELEKAGCDIDAAPGAISPFDPDADKKFRTVTTRMDGGPSDGSEWGGDPNAYNDSGDDNWGVPAGQ